MTLRSYDFNVAVETDELPTNATIESSLLATKLTDYTILDDDDIGTLIMNSSSADATVTLPTAADNTSRRITIININPTYSVIVDGEGAETVNGQATVSLTSQYQSIIVQSDGSNWIAITQDVDNVVNDFQTVGSVGDSGQTFAGHIWATDNLGDGTDIAYYEFDSGDLEADSEGTYDLTNVGGITTTGGIFSTDGVNNGVALDGSTQWFTQSTLLDVMPTNLTITFWFNADSGQPSPQEYFFSKVNITDQERISLSLEPDGKLQIVWEENNSGLNIKKGGHQFGSGATGWHHVAVCWSSVSGIALYLDGALDFADPNATTLMNDGTDTNFTIGDFVNSAGAVALAGKISLFKVADHTLTQKDVDLLYATEYDIVQSGTDYEVLATYKVDGSDDYIRKVNFPEIKRTSSKLYRAGFTSGYGLGSNEKLRIVLKG